MSDAAKPRAQVGPPHDLKGQASPMRRQQRGGVHERPGLPMGAQGFARSGWQTMATGQLSGSCRGWSNRSSLKNEAASP